MFVSSLKWVKSGVEMNNPEKGSNQNFDEACVVQSCTDGDRQCATFLCERPRQCCITTKEGVAQNIDPVQQRMVRTGELYREWVCI
jgi:hypothetical protein